MCKAVKAFVYCALHKQIDASTVQFYSAPEGRKELLTPAG
jgi:hypothetical protein